MTPAALCLALALAPAEHATCLRLAVAAETAGEPVAEVLAQAYVESRMVEDASNGGCHGVLQVNPRYFCPHGKLAGCDLIAAGLEARRRWREKRGADWLCAYQAGYAYKGGGCRYEREIRRVQRRIEG